MHYVLTIKCKAKSGDLRRGVIASLKAGEYTIVHDKPRTIEPKELNRVQKFIHGGLDPTGRQGGSLVYLLPADVAEAIEKIKPDELRDDPAFVFLDSRPLLLVETDILEVPWELTRFSFGALCDRFCVVYLRKPTPTPLPSNTPARGVMITKPDRDVEVVLSRSSELMSLSEPKGTASASTPVAAALWRSLQARLKRNLQYYEQQAAGALKLRIEEYDYPSLKRAEEEWLKAVNDLPNEGAPYNLLFLMGHWTKSGGNCGSLRVHFQPDPESKWQEGFLPLSGLNFERYRHPVLLLGCCGAGKKKAGRPRSKHAATREATWQAANIASFLEDFVVKKGARAFIAPRGPVEREVTTRFAIHFFDALLGRNRPLAVAFDYAKHQAHEGMLRCDVRDPGADRAGLARQADLFALYCATSREAHLRIRDPHLACDVFYPAHNADYFQFFEPARQRSLPANITLKPCETFGSVSLAVTKWFADNGTKTDASRLFLADVTVQAFCSLKKLLDKTLVVLGINFHLGVDSKYKAFLYVPNGCLMEDATPIHHIDEYASVYPMLLAVLKHKYGIVLPNSKKHSRRRFLSTDTETVQRMVRSFCTECNQSCDPFVLFSTQHPEQFFKDAFVLQTPKPWSDYFEQVNIAAEFRKLVARDGIDRLNVASYPIQFLVTSRTALEKHPGVFRQLLDEWHIWKTENKDTLPDDVVRDLDTASVGTAIAFVKWVRTSIPSSCFSYGEVDELAESDFVNWQRVLPSLDEALSQIGSEPPCSPFDSKGVQAILDQAQNRFRPLHQFVIRLKAQLVNPRDLEVPAKAVEDGSIRRQIDEAYAQLHGQWEQMAYAQALQTLIRANDGQRISRCAVELRELEDVLSKAQAWRRPTFENRSREVVEEALGIVMRFLKAGDKLSKQVSQ